MAKKTKDKDLDKDTQKVLEEGSRLKSLVQNEGWGTAKMKLIKRVANLLSLNNSDLMNTPADLLLQVMTAKKTAADELLGWLKEIEGDVEQAKGNEELVTEVTESLIYEEKN